MSRYDTMEDLVNNMKICAAHVAARVQAEVHAPVLFKAQELLEKYPDDIHEMFIVFASKVAFDFGYGTLQILDDLDNAISDPHRRKGHLIDLIKRTRQR